MYEYFKQDAWFCGYNSLNFDQPIINYMFDFFRGEQPNEFLHRLNKMSNVIIQERDTNNDWKRWKGNKYFKQIDLMLTLAPKKLATGLKSIQATLHWNNLEEYDWPDDGFISTSDFDKLRQYNVNDILSTEYLLNRLEKNLRLREGIKAEYGFPAWSMFDTTIGENILIGRISKAMGISAKQFKDLSTPASTVDLNEVIHPSVQFKTPKLQKILSDLKSQHTIDPGKKGLEYHFVLDKCKCVIGVGGIHGDTGGEVIKPKDDEYLWDSDVASLYPSLILKYRFGPKHLGEHFYTIYQGILDERLEAKRDGVKAKNEALKFALNGISGKMQQEGSGFYDPFAIMQVRMNGQLFILMLAESLMLAGCTIKQLNTDGILYICPKRVEETVRGILRDWELSTRLTLETEEFTAFYQYTINYYFGVLSNGTIKYKGIFIPDVQIGKGLRPKVVAKAVVEYFTKGTPVQTYIRQNTDIKDFLISEKTGKQFDTYCGNNKIQSINRFYASVDGEYYYKVNKESGQRNDVLSGHPVTLANKLPTELPNNINYNYYIAEAMKIVDAIQPRQLSLW
jgi:hypothetical protein